MYIRNGIAAVNGRLNLGSAFFFILLSIWELPLSHRLGQQSFDPTPQTLLSWVVQTLSKDEHSPLRAPNITGLFTLPLPLSSTDAAIRAHLSRRLARPAFLCDNCSRASQGRRGRSQRLFGHFPLPVSYWPCLIAPPRPDISLAGGWLPTWSIEGGLLAVVSPLAREMLAPLAARILAGYLRHLRSFRAQGLASESETVQPAGPSKRPCHPPAARHTTPLRSQRTRVTAPAVNPLLISCPHPPLQARTRVAVVAEARRDAPSLRPGACPTRERSAPSADRPAAAAARPAWRHGSAEAAGGCWAASAGIPCAGCRKSLQTLQS
ncbi:hypothetical protein B0T14DRAFT_167884 [Immersiella caudata]|uniref:Uncharacterized protein n=1 Tax=Immersiella caudata TaxID=314043 RepID=A0AA39WX10_9PEZI|nr:hypothetical protein B0T14DRAFT_167884 [Immersiella caudata]